MTDFDALVFVAIGAAAKRTDIAVKRDHANIRGRCTSGCNRRKVWKEVVARVSAFEGWPLVGGAGRDPTKGIVRIVGRSIHCF